jgi:bifunctional DNA-binding transcriptional regulator/antitoxin component of YhaV-PrlF toxin-antitoxin module
VIPKDVREKLHLNPKQRLHVMAKGGIITLLDSPKRHQVLERAGSRRILPLFDF